MRRILLVTGLILLSLSSYSRNLRIAFVGDPQVDNAVELDYARRSIYSELMKRKDLDMILFLGDLVNDDASLLEPSRSLLDSLPCPWFSVPGNHDRDRYKEKGRIRDLRTWKSVIGAEDTTFVRNGVRFILMNNVRDVGKGNYEGGFREEQKHYLDSVISATPIRSKVILAAHIPFIHMEGKDTLGKILGKHPSVFLISGHTHTVRRGKTNLGDISFEELTAGAACGTWWRGAKDEFGIPYALQNCGSPRGYFVADIKPKKIRLTYKAVQREDLASAFISRNDDGSSCLYINVYGGGLEGNLSVNLPGVGKTKMLLSADVAPEVLKVIDLNRSMSKEERKKKRSELIPLRKLSSPHLWSLEIPEGVLLRDKLRITYSDPMMKFKSELPVRSM
ncbi:MAG: calcineurin-like phosphoesterase C-terminal domain-containing protein [Bacteroidales bacterium]|nr:calcineurin-like phosphoesterase C-terminal domain-containing protein [Bacteroidales bacterium]